jgi:hypothetical protein
VHGDAKQQALQQSSDAMFVTVFLAKCGTRDLQQAAPRSLPALCVSQCCSRLVCQCMVSVVANAAPYKAAFQHLAPHWLVILILQSTTKQQLQRNMLRYYWVITSKTSLLEGSK